MNIKSTFIFLIYWCNPSLLFAQDSSTVTRQCSAIKELVYAAMHQFASIKLSEVRNSFGTVSTGKWQFQHKKFDTNLMWPEANNSYIEWGQETDDSLTTRSWQYIAEYNTIGNLINAEKNYRYLNQQIIGCQYATTDSTEIDFLPLPPEKIIPIKPINLEVASIYELQIDNGKAGQPSIYIMVGMEKITDKYKVSLIVEHRTIEKK